MTTLKAAVLSAVLAAFWWETTGAPTAASASKPLVLIVSFDGFRWDYLTKVDTPNFDELVASGVKAKYIKDVFITKTFPNHFTLVTGLYEESHGVTGNRMFDPAFNQSFEMTSTDPKWWNGGEPVWIANQKQGGKSSVVLWPSGNVNFSGILPDFYFPVYNVSIPFRKRIDVMVDNFVNDQVNFGALYFHEPDHSGHLFGPDSQEILPILKMCDETAGYLVRRLKESGLYDRIHVIITSDHGMTTISPDRVLVVESFVDPNILPYFTTNNNPIMSIWPENDEDTEAIYDGFHGKSQHMTAYLKEDIPSRYHYSDNRRISPILLVAKEGWQIMSNRTGYISTHLGTHGYNNDLMSMHPFFIAHGPAFKKGFVAEPFSSTNVYTLMCHLLGINPSPNNGSWENVQSLLEPKPTPTPSGVSTHEAGGDLHTGGGGSSGGRGGISKFTIFGK
ncbi:bis(5'-adenosyl)-triphosphatase enpp4-like [Lytechinus pictus]|uniref:bis(5'-adenosyl)-triphosphatase enpp4-like n=1 Tax=Lytechinus pictus TaxID=7653 RepID=UPI0030B9C8CF